MPKQKFMMKSLLAVLAALASLPMLAETPKRGQVEGVLNRYDVKW